MSTSLEFEQQWERYRRMTGEERLAIALQMHEFACDIARRGFDGNTRTKRPSNTKNAFATAFEPPSNEKRTRRPH